MKKRFILLFTCVVMFVLITAGCSKSVYNVSTNEDNTISVTAEKAAKESAGLGYLTVAENEKIVVEPNFEGKGQVQIRVFAGLLGSEDFPETPTIEETIGGTEALEFEAAPGEYTIGIVAVNTVTGNAVISARSLE